MVRSFIRYRQWWRSFQLSYCWFWYVRYALFNCSYACLGVFFVTNLNTPLWYDWIQVSTIATGKFRAEIVSNVYPILSFHDDVIELKHFPRYWTFVRGIHRWPVNSPHKGQWHGALMFFFFICACINSWVNYGEACDLSCNGIDYDVTVMYHLWNICVCLELTVFSGGIFPGKMPVCFGWFNVVMMCAKARMHYHPML